MGLKNWSLELEVLSDFIVIHVIIFSLILMGMIIYDTFWIVVNDKEYTENLYTVLVKNIYQIWLYIFLSWTDVWKICNVQDKWYMILKHK